MIYEKSLNSQSNKTQLFTTFVVVVVEKDLKSAFSDGVSASFVENVTLSLIFLSFVFMPI